MRRLFLALLAVAAVAVPTAGGAQRVGQAASGARGLVTRGPISAACGEGLPCSAPARHTKITFVRSGVATSTVTGTNGRYSILLDPGLYAVRFPTAKFGFRPRSAFITAGRMSRHDFSVDTGIR